MEDLPGQRLPARTAQGEDADLAAARGQRDADDRTGERRVSGLADAGQLDALERLPQQAGLPLVLVPDLLEGRVVPLVVQVDRAPGRRSWGRRSAQSPSSSSAGRARRPAGTRPRRAGRASAALHLGRAQPGPVDGSRQRQGHPLEQRHLGAVEAPGARRPHRASRRPGRRRPPGRRRRAEPGAAQQRHAPSTESVSTRGGAGCSGSGLPARSGRCRCRAGRRRERSPRSPRGRRRSRGPLAGRSRHAGPAPAALHGQLRKSSMPSWASELSRRPTRSSVVSPPPAARYPLEQGSLGDPHQQQHRPVAAAERVHRWRTARRNRHPWPGPRHSRSSRRVSPCSGLDELLPGLTDHLVGEPAQQPGGVVVPAPDQTRGRQLDHADAHLASWSRPHGARTVAGPASRAISSQTSGRVGVVHPPRRGDGRRSESSPRPCSESSGGHCRADRQRPAWMEVLHLDRAGSRPGVRRRTFCVAGMEHRVDQLARHQRRRVDELRRVPRLELTADEPARLRFPGARPRGTVARCAWV